MDGYTKKYFLGKIEEILEERPIDEVSPVFLYRAPDGLLTLLTKHGNQAVGNIELIAFAEVLGCSVAEAEAYLQEAISTYWLDQDTSLKRR